MKCEQKVLSYIKRNALLSDREKVLVGFSGGPDSVCLVRMLHRLQYEVIALHCNFHLRGAESDRDQAFAENLCRTLGIECHVTHFDTSKWAAEHKVSIEMAARELRYDYFRKMKAECGAGCIAVGHHKGDNAETMLLNILRGTGIDGMCGIRPKNDDIIRPLLCLSREEILQYLKDKNQDYVTDHTNLSNEYARNKVRLDILPLMEGINSAALEGIIATIENMNEVRKVYEKSIEEGVKRTVTKTLTETTTTTETETDAPYININIKALLEEPSPISILHEVLKGKGFNRKQEMDVMETVARIDEGEGVCGKVFSSKEYRLTIDRECIIIEKNECAPQICIDREIVDIEHFTMKKDARYAYLDADKLKGGIDSLTVRTPKNGDSFAPFGMKGRRKLVSDFLTDQKLSRFEKERQPLLCDGEEIAWVVGIRSSELYRVDDTTRRVLILCLKS